MKKKKKEMWYLESAKQENGAKSCAGGASERGGRCR